MMEQAVFLHGKTRDGNCLLRDGYLFKIRRKMEKKVQFRCRKPACRATVFLDPDQKTVLYSNDRPHNHAPNPTEIGVRKFHQNLRQNILEQPNMLIPHIYKQTLANTLATAEIMSQIPKFDSVKNYMYGVRAVKKPAPSAAAAKPSQTNLQPKVVIKEEPIDIDEHPGPSTSRTDEEYILPCMDSFQSGTTPTVGEAFTLVKTEPVEEHQVITSNGKTTKPSQKKTSKKADISEVDPSITENKSVKNHLDAYGEYIAGELKMLDSKSCAHVQRVIADLLFDAKLGKFK